MQIPFSWEAFPGNQLHHQTNEPDDLSSAGMQVRLLGGEHTQEDGVEALWCMYEGIAI